MILFETRYPALFNLAFHFLLKQTIIENDYDIGIIVEECMPAYLRREVFQKCEAAILHLEEWTMDVFYHRMPIFEQYSCYCFLKYKSHQNYLMDDFAILDDYSTLYKKILQKWKIDQDEIQKNYRNLNWYMTQLQWDPIFEKLENLYKAKALRSYFYGKEHLLPIYYDILPYAIKSEIEPKEDIYYRINQFLEYLFENISNGSLAYLFWNHNKPCSETEIQVLLENIIDAYFYQQDIDISRECSVGYGKIDFKFYKSIDEKVLFELKKANNPYLKKGLSCQLINYMKSLECKKAFYIVLCFSDEDMKKGLQFVENSLSRGEYYPFIQTLVLDLRLMNKSIQRNYQSIYYTDVPNKVDSYFDKVPLILELTKRDAILKYLKMLLHNYYKLGLKSLQLEYVQSIREICTKQIDYSKSIFDFEHFYSIFDGDDVLQNLTFHLLGDVGINLNVDKVIKPIIEFYNNFEEVSYGKRITSFEIEKIFSFLEKYYPSFFRIVKKVKMKIFLIDMVSWEYNSTCIPSVDLKSFCFVCTYMKDEGISPIYVFFHLLGLVFGMIVTGEYLGVPSDFIKSMQLSTVDPNISSFFADCLAMYLMHKTEYDLYNPFQSFSEEFYRKNQNYFETLFSKIGSDFYDTIC